ncbi:uncharacterized protein LOC128681559 isoform X2 [Plodia interpunctella]|uniref:uncharacterized protein LOC128681559 isoform X2 n=1 Tax=Plodia interpunctella TaxID=58824 RepID=UPI002367F9EB|nr:uncharacterized protein LOC128681559 isoform X2 [Plodia interpunctella]
MSQPGRGRGYPGRHHAREPRPGDAPEAEGARTVPDVPRAPAETVLPIAEDGTDDEVLASLLAVDEQYAPLLALLEQFSPGEDGIQFNRKLRNFEATVTKMCPDETTLKQAFASFNAAALRNSATARKLASVGASFTRQQRRQLLRGALLNVVLQGTFSRLDVLERANPQYLINAANLMGDYFAEARLCNGNKVHILAGPLMQYLRALLASDHVRAHRSLATQLMQNGRELLAQRSPAELDELSVSVRLRLLAPPAHVIWLLLAADLCLNKFLPLPNTLQQFYASHLELSTDENYSEVSYGSWKKDDKDLESSAEKVNQNMSQISLSEETDVKPKLRPILGAGLLRQEQALSVSQDNFETWTPKSLSKRYDLNSWRQGEEEGKDDGQTNVQNIQNVQATVQTVQSNVQNMNYPVTVPDYPTPNRFYSENVNYLQQGDGTYIQNQFPPAQTQNFAQGDFIQFQDRPQQAVEHVNNEVQKSHKPLENWRVSSRESNPDPNRNKRWSRQRSGDDEDTEAFTERAKDRSAVAGGRRHAADVPRSHKYWDHDDRTDRDYNS